MKPVRVMFVCLGNICRSPLAQGIFEDLVRREGLEAHFEAESSGIGAWHVGEKPDVRMRRTAKAHDIDLDDQRAQQLSRYDLKRFDYLYAMDRSVERDMLLLDRSGALHQKVSRFSVHDPDPDTHEVPDPYFEGNFELVYTIVDRTCRSILDMLVQQHNLKRAP